jgi:sulfur-carrier protein adenylyltransferase/sulfurtransferase
MRPELTPDDRERYSRHLLIPGVGEEGQRKIKGASVLMIGTGGLGSPAALYLAAAGVGRIGLVDPDIVDRSNLQRQILHGEAWVGKPKLDSAAARLRELAPGIQLDLHRTRFAPDNAIELATPYDRVFPKETERIRLDLPLRWPAHRLRPAPRRAVLPLPAALTAAARRRSFLQ